MMRVKSIGTTSDFRERLYLRMGEISPRICRDSRGDYIGYYSFCVYPKRARWRTSVETMVVINTKHFVATYTEFHSQYSYGAGWHYFIKERGDDGKWRIRQVTARELSPQRRALVWKRRRSWMRDPFIRNVSRKRLWHTRYKLVMKWVHDDGSVTYHSIFTGDEYELGKQYTEAVRPQHAGGFYVTVSEADARNVSIPDTAEFGRAARAIRRVTTNRLSLPIVTARTGYRDLTDAILSGELQLAVMECQCSGRRIDYYYKEAWTYLRIVREVDSRAYGKGWVSYNEEDRV